MEIQLVTERNKRIRDNMEHQNYITQSLSITRNGEKNNEDIGYNQNPNEEPENYNKNNNDRQFIGT